MKMQSLEFLDLKVKVKARHQARFWSEELSQEIPFHCIANYRADCLKQLRDLEDPQVLEFYGEQLAADIHLETENELRHLEELELGGVGVFDVLDTEMEIEAPLGRVPHRFVGAPEFPALLYDEAAMNFKLNSAPMPVSFMEREIVEFGDGLFKMGELYNGPVFESGVSLLISPMKKREIFLDLLRFTQSLWDESHFRRLPTLASAEPLARNLDLHSFFGIENDTVVLAFRHGIGDEFLGCDLEVSITAGHGYFWRCLQDILASLQWGFRHCLTDSNAPQIGIVLSGLDWVCIEPEREPEHIVMSSYFKATRDEFFSFCTQSNSQFKFRKAYQRAGALREAFYRQT